MKPNRYQLWFESDGGKLKVQLPVNPEKLTVKKTSTNSSVTVMDLGEVTSFGEQTLSEISFSSIFPAKYFTGCSVEKPLFPAGYVAIFTRFMTEKKPVRFTATNFGIVMYVTIESFQYSESGGDVGTYEYSLTMKEYRSAKVKQIKLNKNTEKASVEKKKPTRVNNKNVPKTYTVKSGDCLWNIAKKFYGKGSEYMKIYNANKSIIGSNPNLIYAGQIFTIP